MTKLRISTDLSLPLDTFVTSTQMIVAKKRRGKSYLAQREAEELLEQKQQVVALDPTGAWWGLRSSADGKEPGYPIVVFGGDHGDVPLDPLSGETLARVIVEECFSAVVDLTTMRKGERIRFGAEFLETLYRLNRAAMHLFIDEADVFAPQVTRDPQQARLLGATDELVRRGGLRGVGVTLITQRSQVVSKDVISQIDAMAVLNMNHPKDIAAVRDWMEANYADGDAIEEALRSLPRLPVGTAWYLSPERDLFGKIEISRKRTFDSGRTPKPGERVIAPKALAPVDIARLGKAIAATVERAKADDPKALRARIAELEKAVAAKPSATVETRTVEKPVIKEQQLQRIGVLIEQGDGLIKRWDDTSANAHEALAGVEKRVGAFFEKLSGELAALRSSMRAPQPTNRELAAAHFANDGKETKLVGKHQIRVLGDAPRVLGGSPGRRVYPSKHADVVRDAPAAGLVPAQRRIVDTIATLNELGIESTRTVLAAWLGQHPNTKGLVNNLGALRSAGLVDGFGLTDEGRKVARPSVPRSRAEVREIILRPLPPAQRRIIEVVEQLGEADREELAEALGQHPNTKGLVNNIGSLRGRGLLTQGWPLRLERVFEVSA